MENMYKLGDKVKIKSKEDLIRDGCGVKNYKKLETADQIYRISAIDGVMYKAFVTVPCGLNKYTSECITFYDSNIDHESTALLNKKRGEAMYKIGDTVIAIVSDKPYVITGVNFGHEYYYKVNGGDKDKKLGLRDESIDHFATAVLNKPNLIFILPQPSKNILKSGMRIVTRGKEVMYVLMEILDGIGGVYNEDGDYLYTLDSWLDNLIDVNADTCYTDGKSYMDIMQIFNKEMLIANRVEKSEKELKIEKLEKDVKEKELEYKKALEKLSIATLQN